MRPVGKSFWVLLLAAAAAAGQVVAVDGKVLPVSGPTICMQGETHYLDCTFVYLKSRKVNLKQYVGQLVRVLGQDVSLNCRVVDVQQVQKPSGTLTWSGTPVPSCGIKFRICGPGISAYFLFMGSGPAYYPVNPIFGTILIAPPWIPIAVGVHGGCTDIPLLIPNDRRLIGKTFYFQGLVHAVGPVGPLQTTNAVCVTVRRGMPCAQQ